MKLKSTLITAALLAAITGTVIGAGKLRVYDSSIDGDKRYYKVVCPDGKRSTVSQEFNEAGLIEVCIFPHNGVDECRPSWDLDAAAAASCR